MKTERRHELQKNQLADALGSELDYLRPYYKTIAAVLVAVVAVGATIAILSSQRQAKNAAAWGSFYDVVAEANGEKMPKRLEGLVDAYPGTEAAHWATLAAGDLKLRAGSSKMFTDRKEAEINLDQAKRHFEDVLNDTKGQAALQRRARFGLAETYDAMNEPDKALPILEELAKENADDAFGKAATDRIAQIKRLESEGFYTWFASYVPAPPAEDPLRGRGPLGDLPSTNNLNPDLKAPGIIGSELMETEPEDSPIEFDAPGTKQPRDKKDDAFVPATDTPVEEPGDKKVDAPAPAETPDDKKTEEPAPSDTPAEPKAEDKPAPSDAPAEPKTDEKKADEPPADKPADAPQPE